MTREQYEQLRQTLGDAELDNLVATFGTMVDGQPAPRMTQPMPRATVPSSSTAGPETMSTTGGLAAMDPRAANRTRLFEEYAAYPEQEAQRREAQFKAAEERINKMYAGPSPSQTLYALGQALLSPRKFSGFGGTMYNVSRGLAGINEQRTDAATKRQEALERLRQSYEGGAGEAQLKSMEGRRKILEMEDEVAKAAAEAGKPKYDINPLTGNYQTRPGTGDNLGVLTPEQVLLLKQDPRNRGKTFYTTDGRPGVF